MDDQVKKWEAEQAAKARDRRVVRETLEADRKAAALDQALTSQERHTAWHALQLAAERFDENANVAVAAGENGLADVFVQQAKDSRALMERLAP